MEASSELPPHDGGTFRGKNKAVMAILTFLARSKRLYNVHTSAPSPGDSVEEEVTLELLSKDVDGSSDERSSISTGKRSLSNAPTASEWKTTLNTINFIVGVDYLAVPFAIKKGGISALVALLLVPVIYSYTGNILIACLYDGDMHTKPDKTRPRSNVRELGDTLLPKYGGYLVKGFQQMDLWILAVSYLVACGSLLRHALPSAPLTEAMWIALVGVIVLPATFFKSLSQIAWLSVFSLLSVSAVVVSVVWYGIRYTANWGVPSLLFWDTEGGLVSISIVLYCYDSFGILLSAEESMTDKNRFGRALDWAYFANTTLKVLFAVLAFFSFGERTEEIILNNLPAGLVCIIVSITSVLSCIFSFPLCLHPVVECIHQLDSTSNASAKCSALFVRATVRVAVVSCTVATAIFLPHFALLVSFWGSLSVVLCMVILPCVIHLKLNFRHGGLRLYKIFIDLLLIIFGVVAWIIGSVFTGKALFGALFTNKPEPRTNAH